MSVIWVREDAIGHQAFTWEGEGPVEASAAFLSIFTGDDERIDTDEIVTVGPYALRVVGYDESTNRYTLLRIDE